MIRMGRDVKKTVAIDRLKPAFILASNGSVESESKQEHKLMSCLKPRTITETESGVQEKAGSKKGKI